MLKQPVGCTAKQGPFSNATLEREKSAKDAIFYSYTKHINGFAANLEEEEAMEIAKHSDVVSVFPNKGRELHTTRSWEFLGLEKMGKIPMVSLWRKARFGENVIIGSIDTGVWPELASFDDHGMGPVPSKWRGICQNSTLDGLRCNRKLIGVRYFKKAYEANQTKLAPSLTTARDFDGHGTHTLSTAAGRFVRGVSVLGQGNGTAKGGAPKARVAAYKVCWDPFNGKSCYDADIIAAFDAAIHDGVDIISISLGGDTAKYFDDAIAIGSFHAMKHGISVVCSAGNLGNVGSVSNTAPWLVTVAASTMDREFSSYVVLGNKKRLKGESICSSKIPEEKLYPLIKAGDAKAPDVAEADARFCSEGTLDPQKVKGKIVVCLTGPVLRADKETGVFDAGGVGIILINDRSLGSEVPAVGSVLPMTRVSATYGTLIFNYIDSTPFPTAYITPSETKFGAKPAPVMASFSSLGPNPVVAEILKPDITAPGVNIIAALTQARWVLQGSSRFGQVKFDMDSGTSIACPHITAVAGLLKAIHPGWSPAAIRSAMMTTAYVKDNTKQLIRTSRLNKANPFGFGAGHVRPNRATDPGLVYDLTAADYLSFLCSLGYTPPELKKITSTPYGCPDHSSNLLDFNYPSITVPNLIGSANVTRILKNVGTPGTYTVHIKAPHGVLVSVEPEKLTFKYVGDVKQFRVIMNDVHVGTANDYVFGGLKWTDGVHKVRSPLVVKVARVANVQ